MANISLPTSYPAKVTMTNLLKVSDIDDKVWNTGMSMAGDPHCDEPVADAGKAIVVSAPQLLPEIKKGQAVVAVFGLRNQYWVLDAGESVTFNVENDEAAVYYLQQNSSDLSVTIEESGEETGDTAEVSDADSL